MSTYVYGFTHETHPLAVDGLAGVGVAAAAGAEQRRARRSGERRAGRSAGQASRSRSASSRARGAEYGRDRAADAVRHRRADTTPLSSPNSTPSAPRYRQLLAQLAGCVELNVKAVHREDAVLSELLQRDPPLRERNRALRASWWRQLRGQGGVRRGGCCGTGGATRPGRRGRRRRPSAATRPRSASVHPSMVRSSTSRSLSLTSTGHGFDASVSALRAGAVRDRRGAQLRTVAAVQLCRRRCRH